jgi:multidrug efflux pump
VLIGAPSTQWWVQMATAIIFGLAFATLLTLVVTPCLVTLPHVMRQSWRPTLARLGLGRLGLGGGTGSGAQPHPAE